MDALNFMMSDQRVPVPNRRVVREYFRRSKTLQKRKSYYSLIDACLSQELRGDVRYLISSNLFAHVWWLGQCERAFLEDLSVFIERESFAAKEKVTRPHTRRLQRPSSPMNHAAPPTRV